jgi:glycerol-3-phosphate dehydrogenase
VHLVFTHERLPVSESVYFDDFKGRMLFAIPRNGVTYVGTTDTDFDGDKDNITCNENDVKYILNATNAIFDIQPLTKEDVISSWAGLRPLIGEQGKPASEVSRKDEIFESASGLISIAGGKLTGYRKMAERLVDFIVGKADEGKYSACQTEFLKLTENAFADYDAVNDFILQLFERYGQLGLTKQECTNLVWTYGKASAQILEKVQNLKDSKSAFSNNLLKVEIEYCISFESVWRPSDYFIRRTGMLYFNPQKLIDNFELIINTFQEHFEWDALTLQSVIAESKKQINNSLLKPVL